MTSTHELVLGGLPLSVPRTPGRARASHPGSGNGHEERVALRRKRQDHLTSSAILRT